MDVPSMSPQDMKNFAEAIAPKVPDVDDDDVYQGEYQGNPMLNRPAY